MDGSLEPAAALLERATGYALGAVRSVTPRLSGRATPCADWDLDDLLRHLCDSLAALCEGIDAGYVGVPGPGPSRPVLPDPVAEFRSRAGLLLGVCAASRGPAGRLVTVTGLPLTAGAVAGAGALEIAVHGWDVSRTTNERSPLPAALAEELLPLAHALLPTPAERPPLFAPPLPPPPGAGPAGRLLAFLGRDPDWPARRQPDGPPGGVA